MTLDNSIVLFLSNTLQKAATAQQMVIEIFRGLANINTIDQNNFIYVGFEGKNKLWSSYCVSPPIRFEHQLSLTSFCYFLTFDL